MTYRFDANLIRFYSPKERMCQAKRQPSLVVDVTVLIQRINLLN
jgi:hypothetical protein